MSKCERSRALVSRPNQTSGSSRRRTVGGWTRAIVRAAGMLWLMAAAHAGLMEAQISPGPLARAHQTLNGAGNCTRCHAASVRSRSFLCLDCHHEIADEL